MVGLDNLFYQGFAGRKLHRLVVMNDTSSISRAHALAADLSSSVNRSCIPAAISRR
jgi:hypothetical protein